MKVRDELREMRMIIKDVILGIKELQESQKKTDEQLKKTDKQLKETDKQLKKMIGELTDGWGKFVEGLVEPSVREVFKEVGIEVRETFQRPTASINERNLEIDIVGIGREAKLCR